MGSRDPSSHVTMCCLRLVVSLLILNALPPTQSLAQKCHDLDGLSVYDLAGKFGVSYRHIRHIKFYVRKFFGDDISWTSLEEFRFNSTDVLFGRTVKDGVQEFANQLNDIWTN